MGLGIDTAPPEDTDTRDLPDPTLLDDARRILAALSRA